MQIEATTNKCTGFDAVPDKRFMEWLGQATSIGSEKRTVFTNTVVTWVLKHLNNESQKEWAK